MSRLLRTRRLIASILLVIFLQGTFLPMGVASAQAILFSKSGLGVSRLPLNVWAFEAPGFGDLVDAINLANGNVYASVGGLARNNQGALSSNTMTGNWNLENRYKLHEFHTSLGASGFPIPGSLTLSTGDSSYEGFSKVATINFADTTLPSWITRYQNTTNAHFYKNYKVPNKQHIEEWIVILVQKQLRTGQPLEAIAHYYDHGGSRYTFYLDGKYVDYIQNPYQQFQGASENSDTEGITTSYKTSLCYNPSTTDRALSQCTPAPTSGVGMVNEGRLRQVKDQWGRVTTYKWGGDTALDTINHLLRVGTDEATFAQQTNFYY
jgi:hypothetical protein